MIMDKKLLSDNVGGNSTNTPLETLPGGFIMYSHINSSGSCENAYGNGSVSLSISTPSRYCKYIDLGEIYYSSPTKKQMAEMEGSDIFTEAGKERSNVMRRLSKKQATYIQLLVTNFLASELKGYIPPDDEITAEMLNEKKGF